MNHQEKRKEHETPDPNRTIHWAVSQEEVDAAQARNWVTEDLIAFSQKHWNCSREKALERLLTSTER